jgi:adenylyltransferase/sulfurtransferase
MNAFSNEELVRYQRHLSLQGFGPDAQAALKKSTVLVIGAGGLGCPVLLYLAAAGVGKLIIVDDDLVDLSNLQRQVLYTSEDKGQPKVLCAAKKLGQLNPLIQIEVVKERFNRVNALKLVNSCDVVVDGSDNFATRYLVNDACVISGKPFVFGAIQGFDGQLSVFNFKGGPTYRCLFPEPPAAGTVPNCSEAGVLGVLPGLIGTAQACEAIKVLTGIGEPLRGKLFLINALTMKTHIIALSLVAANLKITQLPSEDFGKTCDIPMNEIKEIDATELRAMLKTNPKLQLVDVREEWEREMGAIMPSLHLPLSKLQAALMPEEASLNANDTTVFYCAGGVRSLKAAEILRQRSNFKITISLKGGFKLWELSGS